MITEWVSVARAAHELGISMAEVARLVVHGELKAQMPHGVTLSSQTVRVLSSDVDRVRQRLVDPRGSAADAAEADRILTRRNGRFNWPPSDWSVPSTRRLPPVGVVESTVGVDHTDRVWRWLFEGRRFETPVSEVRKHFTGVGRVISVPLLEVVLTELETLGVVGFVKIRRQGPGPRPRGVRLSTWAWGLAKSGRWVPVARLREGEGGAAE